MNLWVGSFLHFFKLLSRLLDCSDEAQAPAQGQISISEQPLFDPLTLGRKYHLVTDDIIFPFTKIAASVSSS